MLRGREVLRWLPDAWPDDVAVRPYANRECWDDSDKADFANEMPDEVEA